MTNIIDFLLDIVFPRFCVSCGKFGRFFCHDCLKSVQVFEKQVCPYCERPSLYGFTHPRCQSKFGLDGMFVWSHYRGPIVRLVHEVKYAGVFGILKEIAPIMLKNYESQFSFGNFVPIPLSKKRMNERGFNQAELLAKELYKVLSIKYKGVQKMGMVVNLLERSRETKPQFDLKGEERKKNLKDAFSISQKYNNSQLIGLSFCLVDDVCTTGTTIFECAKVLKKAGAKKVWAMVMARGGN